MFSKSSLLWLIVVRTKGQQEGARTSSDDPNRHLDHWAKVITERRRVKHGCDCKRRCKTVPVHAVAGYFWGQLSNCHSFGGAALTGLLLTFQFLPALFHVAAHLSRGATCAPEYLPVLDHSPRSPVPTLKHAPCRRLPSRSAAVFLCDIGLLGHFKRFALLQCLLPLLWLRRCKAG